MRDKSEIQKAEERVSSQVWLERHQTLADQGKTNAAADRDAASIAAELGEDSMGPYTDFEWGMLNGKLSALRWTLGSDWDELSS